ncbi:MAG: trigger factor [Ktedonobacteraceae bacterium]|nr:trigger factor [Ktedonobacteraceae bacterium]
MKVSVERLPTSEAVLNVDVTWDEMEKASEKAYRKLVKQIDIQGFRRGKAPRSIVERRVGKESIYQEGLDDLISEVYKDAVKEHELTPISQPKLDAPVFEQGQDYHFSLTVPVVTPVKLPDYKALHFEREDATVSSEEVDKELESYQSRLTEWKEVERAANYDDRVKADLKLTSEEKQISDLKDNTFELTHERHGLFSGMDEYLVGMKAGESKNFSTTIPTDYSNEKIAGKQADYEVTVHAVEAKEAPAIDDEFAKKISDGQYETIEELSKVISDNILSRKKRSLEEELRQKALDAVIEQSEFVIHPLLIDEEVAEMEHQFGHMLEQQHLNMNQYLSMMKKSQAEYREELRPDAEKRIKQQLVLQEIAVQENISVDPEEIQSLFSAYEQMGQPLPETEEQVRALAVSYRREKTLSRLTELTTDPDPEDEQSEEVVAEAEAIANAEAAVLAGETDESQVAALVDEAEEPQAIQTEEEVQAEKSAAPLSGDQNEDQTTETKE